MRKERNLIFMFIISHSCGLPGSAIGAYLIVSLLFVLIAVRVCVRVCVMDIIAVTCVVKTINYGHLSGGNAVKTL